MFTYIRLLFSWPLGKILTGQVHYRVTLDTLSGYPEPWSLTILGNDRERIKYIKCFFACVSWCLELLSTNMTEPTESMRLYTILHTSGNALASMWFLAWIVTYIQLAVSCLWNEVQDIRKHMQKALNLVSPLSITSWNFWEPVFWIPTKGILSHPKVDWPCQYFTRVN